jgi:tRNA pseudouridine55 synthase
VSRSCPHAPDVAGFLLLDKPSGWTSNRALQRVKRLFGARKAGHTGSLDPLATGMLPIGLGVATKLSRYLLDADKTYRVRARLGAQTDTDDADGTIVAERDVGDLTEQAVRAALAGFLGRIEQTPPMYSALKRGGQPLYKLARRGLEVPREPRNVTIFELELESLGTAEIGLYVRCSKGTYVRTLVTDIARSLGTLGHVAALRRESVGRFAAADMVRIDDLEALATGDPRALEGLLLPPDTVLADWPRIDLDAGQADKLVHGCSIGIDFPAVPGLHRVYSEEQRFLGIGELLPNRRLSPKRIFV